MRAEELIKQLQELAAEHPGLKVWFRQGNGYLSSIEDVSSSQDTFEQWIEIS